MSAVGATPTRLRVMQDSRAPCCGYGYYGKYYAQSIKNLRMRSAPVPHIGLSSQTSFRVV